MNEKRFRFSKSTVDALVVPTKAEVGTVGYRIVWETPVIGFGLQVRPSGIKTFIFVYRNKGGRVKRLTIGRYGRVTVDQARDAVKHYNGVVALGQRARDRRDGGRRGLADAAGGAHRRGRRGHLRTGAGPVAPAHSRRRRPGGFQSLRILLNSLKRSEGPF